MSSTAESAGVERHDVGAVVGGGIKLGVFTAASVTVFALLSRLVSGTLETVVQSVLVLAGGVVFSYLPAFWVRPRSADAIAWTALVGLLGALVFTVLDTALLRPFDLYHWTWDEIGGGSGFWYIPIWWMGSATLAWLGAWVVAIAGRRVEQVNVLVAAAQTVGISIIIFAILTVTRVGPLHTAVMALAFALGLIVTVPLVAALNRQ
ncbi:MAG: hypothetical protein GTO22_20900 [Gemmatimonadales bacterium]|nr:hypothetical protein [Gemmatimonadales bacterium]